MSTDKNNLVYQEQLDDNVIEMLSEDIGSNYSLRTENTRNVVGALNEILGKDIICNAVGSPLLTTDTFAQMGEKIHVMVNDFKAKLLGLGVSVSSIDKMAVLIEKIGEIDLGVDAEELLAPLEESLRETLENKGVKLTGEETVSELILKIEELVESSSTYKPNIIYNSSLPENVINGAFVIMTDNINGTCYFNIEDPVINTDIFENDILVKCSIKNERTVKLELGDKEKIVLNVSDCYQIINGVKEKKDIYYGINNEWYHINGKYVIMDSVGKIYSDYYNSLEKEGGTISFKNANGEFYLKNVYGDTASSESGAVSTTEYLDITAYNTLRVRMRYTGDSDSSDFAFGFIKQNYSGVISAYTDLVKRKYLQGATNHTDYIDYTLDISALTGEYRFGMVGNAHSYQNSSHQVYIQLIVLEP